MATFTPVAKVLTGSGTTPDLATTAINTALSALSGQYSIMNMQTAAVYNGTALTFTISVLIQQVVTS